MIYIEYINSTGNITNKGNKGESYGTTADNHIKTKPGSGHA